MFAILGNFCKPKNAVLAHYQRRAWYETVLISIPVFIAAGLNNVVASIIDLSSEDAKSPESAKLGQQFIYTFIISYFGGKFCFYQLSSYIQSCRNSNSSGDNSVGIMSFLRSTKSLTLCARLFSENSSFAIKEFLLLVLVEDFYNKEGFGVAIGGWTLSWGIFALSIIISALIFAFVFKCNSTMVEWMMDYDLDSFALGVGAMLVAIVAKGLAVEGVVFVGNNSILYGDSNEETHDDGLHGLPSLYNITFTIGILMFSGLVLLLEDIICGNDVKTEVRDKFMDSLPIPNTTAEMVQTDSQGEAISQHHAGNSGVAHHQHSAFDISSEGMVEYFHAILGYVCGVALFVFLTNTVLNWVASWSHTSMAAHFVAVALMAVIITQRTPGCIVAQYSREKRTLKEFQGNREYLEENASATGSYKSTTSSAKDFVPSGTYLDNENPGTTVAENNSPVPESDVTPTWCERKFGRNVAVCWSVVLDYFYRVCFHRRRLLLLALKLTVGWTWEVVVSAFFALVTQSIELSKREQVGIQVAIMIVILILAGITFYFFKDGQDLYLIDPNSLAERVLEVPLQPSVNPMARSNMER